MAAAEEISLVTEAIVSGLWGLRSKTVWPVARSAIATEIPADPAGGRSAAFESASSKGGFPTGGRPAAAR